MPRREGTADRQSLDMQTCAHELENKRSQSQDSASLHMHASLHSRTVLKVGPASIAGTEILSTRSAERLNCNDSFVKHQANWELPKALKVLVAAWVWTSECPSRCPTVLCSLANS